ncbi:MAG: class I SAM-dependent methyltransferase [Candidatus Omnitrophota bacterium]
MLKPKDREYYRGARAEIVDLVIPEAQRVLDIGCACGITGQMLKERGVREVVGVEIDPQACGEAAKRLDRVHLGDVQVMPLPYKEYFDCIIYADVLEHLVDPWSLLKRHRELLREGGSVLASIPNVGHYRVIKKLIKGSWTYDDKGVLDSTHLRFFALKNIRDMFSQAGYRIDKVIYKVSASKIKKALNRVLRGRLNESLSEQFLIKATKI